MSEIDIRDLGLDLVDEMTEQQARVMGFVKTAAVDFGYTPDVLAQGYWPSSTGRMIGVEVLDINATKDNPPDPNGVIVFDLGISSFDEDGEPNGESFQVNISDRTLTHYDGMNAVESVPLGDNGLDAKIGSFFLNNLIG